MLTGMKIIIVKTPAKDDGPRIFFFTEKYFTKLKSIGKKPNFDHRNTTESRI